MDLEKGREKVADIKKLMESTLKAYGKSSTHYEPPVKSIHYMNAKREADARNEFNKYSSPDKYKKN